MIILLSPSKTLDFSNENSLPKSKPVFLAEALSIAKHMQKLSANDIAKLMDVSPKLAELNFERYQDFPKDFDFENINLKQALCCFKGDVYTDIDIDNYNANEVERANNIVRILSGLYGILRPLDVIYPYRLEMGTNTKAIIGKTLYDYWQDKIADYLNAQDSDYIINLASQEYFGAVNTKKINKNIINIDFKEFSGGKFKTVGIHAKRARGSITNWIIKNNINKIDDIKSFNINRYKYNTEISSKTNIVFSR